MLQILISKRNLFADVLFPFILHRHCSVPGEDKSLQNNKTFNPSEVIQHITGLARVTVLNVFFSTDLAGVLFTAAIGNTAHSSV